MDKCRSYIAKMKEDDRYKAEIFLCLGFCLNMLYCIWNVVCGIFVHSLWLWTMAFWMIRKGMKEVKKYESSAL